MSTRITKVLCTAIALALLASVSTSAYAGSNERVTRRAAAAKCKMAVTAKKLKGDAYTAEYKKCLEAGDSYN